MAIVDTCTRPVTSLTPNIVVRFHPTPQGLPWLPSAIPRKPTDPKTNKTQNEGAPQKQLHSWGTILTISFSTDHHPVYQLVVGGDAGGAPVDEAIRPANSDTLDMMSEVTAYAPLLARTPQVWIRGKLWHATRLSFHVPVEVLVDTGAWGGKYTSLLIVFTKAIETNPQGGKSIISSAAKGFLRAAIPRNSDVAPMEVIGSCVIPMVLSPVDRVFRISFRIVRDLPCADVLGAAFLKEHHSTVSFREKEGFTPTSEST